MTRPRNHLPDVQEQPLDVREVIANLIELRASLRRNRPDLDPNLYQQAMNVSGECLELLTDPLSAKLTGWRELFR